MNTLRQIERDKKNVLAEHGMLDVAPALKGYKYVDELQDMQEGTYVRWIHLHRRKLTNGAFLVRVDIREDGIYLLMKNSTSDLKEMFWPTAKEAFTEADFSSYMDGEPSGASLSMLAANRVTPDCCPSTYSTSNGCVCLTNEQLEDIRNRGGNRS